MTNRTLLDELHIWETETVESLTSAVAKKDLAVPDRRFDRHMAVQLLLVEQQAALKALLRRRRRWCVRPIEAAVICDTFERIKNLAEQHGLESVERMAFANAHRYQCQAYLRSRNISLIMRWPAYYLWGLTSGFGTGIGRWLASVAVLVVMFGAYHTRTPDVLEPAIRPFSLLRPQLVLKQAPDSGTGPTFGEGVYYSAMLLVGFDSETWAANNPASRVAKVFLGGGGLVLLVVLGHLLSLRITDRVGHF